MTDEEMVELIRQTFNATTQTYDTEPPEPTKASDFYRRKSNKVPRGQEHLFDGESVNRTEYE